MSQFIDLLVFPAHLEHEFSDEEKVCVSQRICVPAVCVMRIDAHRIDAHKNLRLTDLLTASRENVLVGCFSRAPPSLRAPRYTSCLHNCNFPLLGKRRERVPDSSDAFSSSLITPVGIIAPRVRACT